MKKKIYALAALFLAICLVMPNIPAKAAKPMQLNAKSKTLFLNKNNLSGASNSFDFNVKNKIAGSTYKWTSSNKLIAKVNSKTGVVTAVEKTGKATIMCKVTLKNKKTRILKATVTVKENAKSVTISNAPENNTMLVGSTFDFNRTMATASGANATDYTEWFSSDESVATIAKNGVATALKSGTFNVVCKSYQSKSTKESEVGDLGGYTAESESVKITVKNCIADLTLTKSDELQVTLADVEKDLKATDIVVTSTKTGARSYVKSISTDESGKQLALTMYTPFNSGETYKVVIFDMEKTIDIVFGKPISIILGNSSCIRGETDQLDIHLIDAAGIDLHIPEPGKMTVKADGKNTAIMYDSSRKGFYIVSNEDPGTEFNIDITYNVGNEPLTGTFKFKTIESFLPINAEITAPDTIVVKLKYKIQSFNMDGLFSATTVPQTPLPDISEASLGADGKTITIKFKNNLPAFRMLQAKIFGKDFVLNGLQFDSQCISLGRTSGLPNTWNDLDVKIHKESNIFANTMNNMTGAISLKDNITVDIVDSNGNVLYEGSKAYDANKANNANGYVFYDDDRGWVLISQIPNTTILLRVTLTHPNLSGSLSRIFEFYIGDESGSVSVTDSRVQPAGNGNYSPPDDDTPDTVSYGSKFDPPTSGSIIENGDFKYTAATDGAISVTDGEDNVSAFVRNLGSIADYNKSENPKPISECSDFPFIDSNFKIDTTAATAAETNNCGIDIRDGIVTLLNNCYTFSYNKKSLAVSDADIYVRKNDISIESNIITMSNIVVKFDTITVTENVDLKLVYETPQ